MAGQIRLRVSKRGPRGAIEPEDRERFDRAAELGDNLAATVEQVEGNRSQSQEAAGTAVDAAGAAGQHAGTASAAAGRAAIDAEAAAEGRAGAVAASDQAANYAAAAAQGARFSDTIAIGRASVANGETFGVRAGGTDGLLRPTVYRRDSATTHTPVVELADNSEVVALSARVGASGNNFLLVAYDDAGTPVAYLDDMAEWHLARLGSKSLQQHIIDANEQIGRAQSAITSIDLTTSTALWRVLTSDGRSPFLLDDLGNLYLARLGTKPLQQHIQAAQERLVEAAPAIESVQRVASPHIRRMTSAEGHVIELTDELGNWYLPRLGGKAVQDHILQMRDKFAELPGNAVKEMLKRRRVYDAVHDFAVPNDGITDASPAVQAAYDFLGAQANILGPSVLYFPQGVFRLDAYITPKSNVTTVMAGWGKSRFLPTGIQSAFLRNASPPLTRANFIDVEIDGTEQFYEGGPRVSTKGMFFQRWADCQFLRCYIHDTWATGLGIDFSADEGASGAPGGSWIIDGRFEDCGRGSQFNDPGSSGIGIGTGKYAKEPLIISRNICRGNRNFGIFLERQHSATDLYIARQNIITENICSENGAGIGEVGAGSTVLNSNQCNDNVLFGIYLYGGTIGGSNDGPHPGIETMVSENVAIGNGSDGLRWDGTLNKPAITTGFYTNHNQFHRNGGAGMRFIGKIGQEMVDFALRGDEIKGNAQGGIVLQQGSFRGFDILHARIIDNTGVALQIDAALADSRILGLTARSTLGMALQTTAISGLGALTNVDISECVQTGHATPNALTGVQTNITLGRNPGFTFT
ncbi:right-handed parallel beta-helix repeat-containing protein [Paracoccus sp. PAR01]|uniref:right-handed parallel beta-helix repeat-containing protein n=1 Tax=Paracoccus sp. PAR01 TaxID=2769282 RepID=UPI001785C535|nr:right-handed parallel beta-helix repeat-containing protein [Paracoccus sp. PAR01]MBD9528371.1 right-handed parallel beta-helix repeat-containing protein [Paracoccus sp. PAR01]